MSDLKPCPLCGGEATVEYGRDINGNRLYKVVCRNLLKCSITPDTPYLRNEDDDVKAWNRRAET